MSVPTAASWDGSLTDLAVSAHQHLFSPKHDVGGSLQPERPVQTSETVAVHQCVRKQLPYPLSTDSLQQYRLSNFCLVTESFTLMAGRPS